MDNTTTEAITHTYQPEFHVIEEEFECFSDYSSDNYTLTLFTIPLFSSFFIESVSSTTSNITATSPYEALDKTKQIISNLMEENGYLYLDETLTSVTFDSEETGEIIRVFNIRLQIIE